MIFLIGVSVIYFVFNEELMNIFTDDAIVIAMGAEWIQILSYSFLFTVGGWWPPRHSTDRVTQTPTKINLVFFWMIQIPLCWYRYQTELATIRCVLGRVYFRNIGWVVYAVAFYTGWLEEDESLRVDFSSDHKESLLTFYIRERK